MHLGWMFEIRQSLRLNVGVSLCKVRAAPVVLFGLRQFGFAVYPSVRNSNPKTMNLNRIIWRTRIVELPNIQLASCLNSQLRR